MKMNGVEKSRVLPLRPEYPDEKVVLGMGSSVEEVEVGWRPPRPVAKVVVGEKKGRRIQVEAHIQVLRIRAEDSQLGEDVGLGNYLRMKDGFGVATHFMLFSSRPVLPASPLRGMTTAH